MIKVIILDDHALFRMTLAAALTDGESDICVAGSAGSGDEFFRLLITTEADIVLLDVILPDMTGIEIARKLKQIRPAMKILAISAENTAETVKELLAIDIEGFISKQSGNIDEIRHAIRAVAAGETYFGKDISTIIYELYMSKKHNSQEQHNFTDRELEIINLCREGLLGKEIAERLNISLSTVNNHKNNIFRKLGVGTTMEMVQYALKHRIICVE